jgi:hypothetical protein
LEDPANRVPAAVRRTAPMAPVLYRLIVAWFHRTGHKHVQFPDRPWYRQKHEPSFADMLTTLRRMSWEEYFRHLPITTRIVRTSLARITEFPRVGRLTHRFHRVRGANPAAIRRPQRLSDALT